MLNSQELARALSDKLTVGQIRHMLEDYPDDAVIAMQVPYGDHGNTQQALFVGDVMTVEDAGFTGLEKTAYSASGFAFGEDEPTDDAETHLVVVFTVCH